MHTDWIELESDNVVTAVFVLGTLNFCLGIALAVAADRYALLSMGTTRLVAAGERSYGSDQGPSLEQAFTNASPVAIADWAAVLVDEQIATSSQFEALLWVTKLQTGRMRTRAIALAPEADADAVVDVEGFSGVVSDWKSSVSEWMELASEFKDEQVDIGRRLEECLLDLAFELQAASEAAVDERQAVDRLHSLIEAAHVCRDDLDELLVEWRNTHGQHGDLPRRFTEFGEHRTLTRLGIEELFVQWRHDDPEGLRLVSLVLIDLDRFARLNSAVGPRLGDVAIEGFAGILQQIVREDRGFDRLGRVRGDRFLAFLGDTSSKNAAKGADRIRQMIEASSCGFGDELIPMTASCAVLEMSHGEAPQALLKRADAVLSEAKKAGRNRTFRDSKDGPVVVELPQYDVCSTELSLETR